MGHSYIEITRGRDSRFILMMREVTIRLVLFLVWDLFFNVNNIIYKLIYFHINFSLISLHALSNIVLFMNRKRRMNTNNNVHRRHRTAVKPKSVIMIGKITK